MLTVCRCAHSHKWTAFCIMGFLHQQEAKIMDALPGELLGDGRRGKPQEEQIVDVNSRLCLCLATRMGKILDVSCAAILLQKENARKLETM